MSRIREAAEHAAATLRAFGRACALSVRSAEELERGMATLSDAVRRVADPRWSPARTGEIALYHTRCARSTVPAPVEVSTVRHGFRCSACHREWLTVEIVDCRSLEAIGLRWSSFDPPEELTPIWPDLRLHARHFPEGFELRWGRLELGTPQRGSDDYHATAVEGPGPTSCQCSPEGHDWDPNPTYREGDDVRCASPLCRHCQLSFIQFLRDGGPEAAAQPREEKGDPQMPEPIGTPPSFLPPYRPDRDR